MKKTFVISALVTVFLGMEFASQASGQAKGTINGHSYVDLGLSVKWATCNVGASYPSDYGGYYAWGETGTKRDSEYVKEHCATYGRKIGSIAGNATYDAARVNWGGSWRMPTAEEMDELTGRCSWQWTTQGGSMGFRVTGPNGNSIFLPAARKRDGSAKYMTYEYGEYWTATPVSNGDPNDETANSLLISRNYIGMGWGYRFSGYSIRPVSN